MNRHINTRRGKSNTPSLIYGQFEPRHLLAADFSNPTIIDFNTNFDTQTIAVADKLVFSAVEDPALGNELVLLDSVTGQRQVVEINPGSQGTSISLLGSEGNLVFFSAWHPSYGNEVHWLDVTEANPQVNHIDAEPGTDSLLRVQNLHVAGSNVFFNGETETYGEEFYSFDFNVGASSLVFVDVYEGSNSIGARNSDPENFVVAGNKVFFHAYDADGANLFWVDLSAANPTANSYDVEPYRPSLDFIKMTVANDRVYLHAEDDTFGVEPRWIDATEADPVLNTIDLRSGTSGSNGGSYFLAGNHLYFRATTASTGSDLFRIDTTETLPTVESLDIYAGDRSSWPGSLTIVGDKLFLTATADNGNDLHWIDIDAPTFTINGINLSSDVTPAAASYTAVGNKLFFTAITEQGREIHWLDLTDLSLPPEELDLYVGEDSSETAQLTASGNRLYFHAETETDDRKVRWLDASNPSVANTIDSIEGEGLFGRAKR